MAVSREELTRRLQHDTRPERDFAREIAQDVLVQNPGDEYSTMVLDILVEIGDIAPARPLEDGDKPVNRPRAGQAASNQFGTFAVHAASERQLRFVEKLLATRVTEDLSERNARVLEQARQDVAAGSISKKLASSAIDILLVLPERPTADTPLATEKQVALIRKLAAAKQAPADTHGMFAWGSDFDHWYEQIRETFNRKAASELIDWLISLPDARVTVTELEQGMYRRDGRIFKVQRAVHGSGNLYAKELVDGSFQYAAGEVRKLRPEHRMTLDEAKEYGALYGVCVVCARTLTDEKSIAAGIGPICARKV